MKEMADELKALVETVSQKLAAVSEEQASVKPSAGDWSKKEIVGHLIDSAANNHQRFVRAQLTDTLVFPEYAQEAWVDLQGYHDCAWQLLVALWRLYNLHLSSIIGRITPDNQGTVCEIGSNAPVTLRFLVEDYLAHMRMHLKQLGC
jgi:hypothetical protein